MQYIFKINEMVSLFFESYMSQCSKTILFLHTMKQLLTSKYSRGRLLDHNRIRLYSNYEILITDMVGVSFDYMNYYVTQQFHSSS